MDFNFPRPEKTLSILNDFQRTKKMLNEFDEEEKLVRFLDRNATRYNISGKIDVVLHNFEKNTLFLFNDDNKVKIFDFLDRSELRYNVSENLIYKMYLYFSGKIDEKELKSLLIRYSGDNIKKLNFRWFIEKNSSELFDNFNFPKILNGEYFILEELGKLIQEKPNILKNLEYWQENILKYLVDKDINKEILEKIYKEILKNYDEKVSIFFEKNKKIEIKSIIIEFKNIGKRNFKIIKIELEKNDMIILGENVLLKNKKIIFDKKEKYLWYLKNKKVEKLKLKSENIFTKYSLLDALEKNYSLNKFYSIQLKLKRFFSEIKKRGIKWQKD